MELQRDRPPAYHTNQRDLKLPSVPTHDVPATASPPQQLPDFRSLGLPEAKVPPTYTDQWMSYRQNGQLNASAFPAVPTTLPRPPLDNPLGSPMATESVLSDGERGARAPSVMSVDDRETMMAAEALSGLRNPEFMRSPSARSTTMSVQPPVMVASPREDGEEPLLSLVTASHPWLGGTINGSVAAYNTTKYYSPAFVRNGAEFVERNIGTPIASTLRRTGVEGGVRRYLGDRRPSDFGAEEERERKRLRESSPDKDVEKAITSPTASLQERRSRAGSQASFVSLPPYDENKSPRYEETAVQDPNTRQPMSPSWRAQLVITTSGLGAALSEVSLKNLRFCLGLLRGASESITVMMDALKKLLDEYDEATRGRGDDRLSNYTLTQEQEAASSRIAERIKAYHHDIMTILSQIKNSISRYAGAALPQNAAALVRRQLMSIPQRWQVAESTAEQNSLPGVSETAKAGNRMVVFAGQSLDMLAQVTMVVGATIQNAEGWLERMGKRQSGEGSSVGMGSPGLPISEKEKQPMAFGAVQMPRDTSGDVVMKDKS